MAKGKLKAALGRSLSDYGMIFVLLILCAVFGFASIDKQYPEGANAGRRLAADIVAARGADVSVIVAVGGKKGADAEMADALAKALEDEGVTVLGVVKGEPDKAGEILEKVRVAGQRLDVVAADDNVGENWLIFGNIGNEFPGATVMTPQSYSWPTFLMPGNLIAIADQIAIIAIMAIGMTAVIITGGIDLSVGSLVALSGAVTGLLVRDWAGGQATSAGGLMLCCLGGIALCALVGAFTGGMVTAFDIPPFIATLAMMLVARGTAMYITGGHSIGLDLPESFTWLGRSSKGVLFNIPNCVFLAAILYVVAHVVMTRTKWGRYVYAIGGNAEAARLSGVPVRRIKLTIYTLCGGLAGLGGIIAASQNNSGDPTIGVEYELVTIAAVVVGGTSLAGGEGKILGTLIGALIIAVIRNGMNIVGVSEHPRKIILGFLILAAVLLDMMKRKGWTKKGWTALTHALGRR